MKKYQLVELLKFNEELENRLNEINIKTNTSGVFLEKSNNLCKVLFFNTYDTTKHFIVEIPENDLKFLSAYMVDFCVEDIIS